MNNVTVFNLTQKSEFDMKAWSEAMEEEREKLTASFIMSANAICSTLHRFGYWADFIDPSSGRPYMGDYTNHTLFETNDAYKQMGFKIEDLGCCKVLQHACWGSNAFVGTIFTDAPVDGDAVRDILKKVTQEVQDVGISETEFLKKKNVKLCLKKFILMFFLLSNNDNHFSDFQKKDENYVFISGILQNFRISLHFVIFVRFSTSQKIKQSLKKGRSFKNQRDILLNKFSTSLNKKVNFFRLTNRDSIEQFSSRSPAHNMP